MISLGWRAEEVHFLWALLITPFKANLDLHSKNNAAYITGEYKA